ncbi:uncharacterized protein GGS22DRAFT_194879 [Annulohypoxylon maeteangense]|uniref:uncharacterized protein n=1 Tax=Annulohypoxylon maeteangense TaxID=1927788 RepID=UPI0020079D6F|nr:uncharacterized protein GGS22DRAFT_194879 [Annulohypoxylon maeteangense]KAI0884375.1 hypothetical protein GGS22DRAFT_194879 [Annulohypoxylon maeteangense]
MAPNAANSNLPARNGALIGVDESQESQDLLIKHMLEHGLGVTSISPVPVDLFYQSKRDTAGSSIGPPKADNSHLVDEQDGGLKSTKQPRNASNTLVTSAPNDSARQSIQPRLDPASRPFSNLDANVALAPTRPILDDAAFPLEGLSQSTRNNPLPTLPPRTFSKTTDKMSSDSPTQSNDGRSYEQYSTNDNSQLESSPQASSVHEPEHPTLSEHDTGFLNFKYAGHNDHTDRTDRTDVDIPDTIPEETQVNFAPSIFQRSHAASQAPEENGNQTRPPETPAMAQRLFGGNRAPLMPASQMFGQTPWTSTVKKASPTSSRPSPDVFNQNTISPNPIISSPLKNRGLRTSPTHAFTSSPVFPGISSRPSGDETPSVPTNSHEDEGRNQGTAAETPLPRFEDRRRKNFPEPIGEYKPLRKQSSETDATKSPTRSGEEQDSDSEVDTAAYRRRLARLKQEKASKSFPAISLPRSSLNKGDKVEVPSTNRTRPGLGRKTRDSEQYLVQRYGKTTVDKDGSQETVADSQEAVAPPQQGERPKLSHKFDEEKIGSSEEQEPPTTNLPDTQALPSNMEYKETIPETSPPSTAIGPPKLIGDIMKQYSSIRSEMEPVSFPVISSGTDPEPQPKQSNEPRSSSAPEPFPSIPANRKSRSSRGRPLESSPSIVLASSPWSAIRRSVRLGDIVTPSSTGRDPPIPSDVGTGTSTLSSLSATPSMTSSITPSTELGHASEASRSRSSSPAIAKIRRRGRPASSVSGPSSSLPQIRTDSRSRESTKRTTRHSSLSTDELAKSPFSVTSTDRQKPPTRKTARAKRNLLRESTVNHGIFEGMVFALSFKDEQGRKNKEKTVDRHSIERMILREGGKILSDGFHELFRFDSFSASTNMSATNVLSSSLTLLNQDAGFTALIADEHSRKTKYMQALALGIPCLAPKWIMNCISKNEIIDWSSYLLCAGPSALLGEAIRSRNLQPYDASTSKLEEVINNRPKLLDQARILLVMKSNRGEEKRLPYVFLAQILGGSLVRVNCLEDARTKLRDGESQGQPFDWVYVDDDNLPKAQGALFGSGAGNGGPKKRKRQSTGTDESDHPPKRIRTLSDQLVIQSLILGRLIEEGEMDE